MASPNKRPRKTPLQALKEGESMIDMTLAIVATDTPRLAKSKKVWSVVASDGHDFVSVVFWEGAVEKFSRDFGSDCVGKTYAFRNFFSVKESPGFNFGSIKVQIQGKESASSVTLLTRSEIAISQENFFQFLQQQLQIDESNFSAVPLKNIRLGETFIDLSVDLLAVNFRTVPVNQEQVSVVDLEVADGTEKAIVTGWNILAEFLRWFSDGKQGSKVSFSGLKMKDSPKKIGKNFLFSLDSSRISISERMEPDNIEEKLSGLIGKRGLLQVSIRLCVLRKQTDFPNKLDGTVCWDGVHKTQFFFPSALKFKLASEFTLLSGNIDWTDSGVLSITIYAESAIERHEDAILPTANLGDIGYPE